MLRKLFCLIFLLFTSLVFAGSSIAPDTLLLYAKNSKNQALENDITEAFKSGDQHRIAEVYNKIALEKIKKGEYLQSINYINIAKDIYTKLDLTKELTICHTHLAMAYYNLQDFFKVIEIYDKAISLNKKKGIDSTVSRLYDDLGFVYLYTHRYKLAKLAFSESLKLKLKNKDLYGCAEGNYFIGNLYFEQEILDSALFYFARSLKYDKKLKNKKEIAASFNNISIIAYRNGLLEKSESYLDSSNTIIKEIEDPLSISILKNNIGNIYFEKKDFLKAKKAYEESLEIKEKQKYESSIALSLHNIANIYVLEKNEKKAIELLNKSIELSKKHEDIKVLAANYRTLSELYKQKGESKLAYEYYKSYILIQNSIYGEEGKQLSELLYKYSEKRNLASSLERELFMQKLFVKYDASIKDKQISSLKSKQLFQSYINYAYAGILLFILAATFFILNRSKIKKKANKDLSEKNQEIEKQNNTISLQAASLAESNRELEKLSVVARDTENAVIIMNAKGEFEWVNHAFTRIFGFTFEELTSKVSTNMISETTPQYIVDKFNYCIEHKSTVNYELQTRTKSGESLWVNVTLTPIFDESGNISRLVSIDSDITSIKNAEAEILQQKEEIEAQRDELQDQRDYIIDQKAELEQKKEILAHTLEELKKTQSKLVESEKMAALGNLVAGISHEINTPIGIGIAASSTMVTKTENLQNLFDTKKMTMTDLQGYLDTTKQACELILSNLNRTAELVKSFKQVSVDNMTEQKRKFNLEEYLWDIIRSLAPKLKNRPIKVIVSCDKSIVLNSYPGAFAQIFTNFIINSLVHAFEETASGEIEISAKTENHKLVMFYRDNGKGISEKNLPKIFDPFFTTNMQIGTGLGMNITYNLITQKLKGDITLKSKENEGVLFTISIPIEETR